MPGPSTIAEDFYKLSDEDAIRLFYLVFAPQIDRLKNAESTVESTKSTTLGKLDHDGKTPSRLLFGRDFVEVNRTMTSMMGIKWVLADDYESFTGYQPAPVKLSKQSFADLRNLVISTLPTLHDKHALLVATVVNDQGKDPSLGKDVEKATGQSCEGLNHDEIVRLAAEADLEPIGSVLNAEFRDDILLGLEFGSKLNISQLAQAEDVPGSLESALIMEGHRRAFNIKFLEVVFDVAGAAGHVDSRCAGTLLEPVFATYLVARHALIEVIDSRVTSRQGYDLILVARADLLQERGFKHLTVDSQDQRALLRLLTMGRVTDKRRAELFQQAFDSLAPSKKERLIDGLDVNGYQDGKAILPYYAPALFALTLKATAGSDDATIIAGLKGLMSLLERVYEGTKSRPGQVGEVVERNLEFAAGTIRNLAMKTDPNVFETLALPWQINSTDASHM